MYKMQKSAEAKGIEADIFAVSAGEADSYLTEKKVDVIPMTDYGMMNGEKVLNQALKLMDK
ncbi:PTS sugar transporter subunit IIB [Clostridium nigeriense]|uniref:PTS sugar transporter subunit IIB n=1 Tax=Clostridium nigeriense TaxID=1805470 RepID=UPI003D336CFC